MSNLPLFGTYAAAFEASLTDDDWSRLATYFTADATYQPGDGSQAEGREAVLNALKASVDSIERKCDGRELVGTPDISEDGDTVTLKYTIRYTRQGSPDFVLVGSETIRFSDGAISAMQDVFEDPQALMAWRASL